MCMWKQCSYEVFSLKMQLVDNGKPQHKMKQKCYEKRNKKSKLLTETWSMCQASKRKQIEMKECNTEPYSNDGKKDERYFLGLRKEKWLEKRKEKVQEWQRNIESGKKNKLLRIWKQFAKNNLEIKKYFKYSFCLQKWNPSQSYIPCT